MTNELHLMLPVTMDHTRDVAFGDVDGDGDLDILFGNGEDEKNRLLINWGAGFFRDAPSRFPADREDTQTVALADVDGDGDLDALVGNYLQQNRLYLNDGSGTFTDATSQLPADSDRTTCIVLGDVNGDGKLDAFVGNCSEQNRLYLNIGGGSFIDMTSKLPADTDPTEAAALGDVDGDGDTDIMIANLNSTPNRLYLNNGISGYSYASTQMPANNKSSSSVALCDVDGDGDLDTLFGNWGSSSGSADKRKNDLYLNDGAGFFTDATFRLPGEKKNTWDLVAGDVDGDGDTDVLVANTYNGHGTYQLNRLYLNDGSGVFSLDESYMPPDREYSLAAALGDVDGDGDLDALIGNFGSSVDSGEQNRLHLNDGTGVFCNTTRSIPQEEDYACAFALGDVDGDGDLDFLAVNNGDVMYEEQDRLYLNNGSGLFTDATSRLPQFLAYSHDAELCDVDGDGDLDAVITTLYEMRLYLNDGSGYFSDASSQFPNPAPGYNCTAMGDVDGDGDIDALIGTFSTIYLFINDGTGVFSDASSQLPGIGTGASLANLSDLDGDGDLDAFLVRGTAFLFVNDGTGVFSDASSQLPGGLNTVGDIAHGDVDTDGDIDFFILSYGYNRIYLLINDGSAHFSEAPNQFPPFSDNGDCIALADVDSDGDLDCFVGNYFQSNRLFLNDGAGFFTDASDLIPARTWNYTNVVEFGDLDGDGDADAVVDDGWQNHTLISLASQIACRTVPRVGKPLVMDIWGPQGGVARLAASTTRIKVPRPPYGTLFIKPSDIVVRTLVGLDAKGHGTAVFHVPASTALIGKSYYWQALLQPPYSLSNLEVTLFTGY